MKKTRQTKGSMKKNVRRVNPMRSRKQAKGKRIVFARTGDGGPTGAGDHNG
ncbi:MAG TPA: hypothetical protein VIG99_28150 [Myxococcaceae bacterium]